MNAEELAKALNGRRCGSTWMARCPSHADRTPSLSITDGASGKLLLHCHAGCAQAEVIAALRASGLWNSRAPAVLREEGRGNPDRRVSTPANRSRAALAIWGNSSPIRGTAVETYLTSRGLRLPQTDRLRFHPRLTHRSGGIWPAMVALVTDQADTAVGIHRTFLARDGSGKAPIEPPKMMLGPCGGGAVRLAAAENTLMVSEGIETALSALQAIGRPVWAALSAPALQSLDLPECIHDVTILADGDIPGERAARHCAARWVGEARHVRVARPPCGQDFNDLLNGKVAGSQEWSK